MGRATRLVALLVSALLTMAGVVAVSSPASAAPAGLTLTVESDDTSTVAGDASATNGQAPVHGGEVSYRWSWADPETTTAVFAQTLPVGMEWSPASVSSGCSLSGSSATGHTLTCSISGLVVGAVGSISKLALVGNVANGAVLSSTLRSGTATSNAAVVTAVGAMNIKANYLEKSWIIAKDPATSTMDGYIFKSQFGLYLSPNELKGTQSLTGPIVLSASIPSDAVRVGCTTDVTYQGATSTGSASSLWYTVQNSGTAVCSGSAGSIEMTITGTDSSFTRFPTINGVTERYFVLGQYSYWVPASGFSAARSVVSTVSGISVTGLDGTTATLPGATYTTAFSAGGPVADYQKLGVYVTRGSNNSYSTPVSPGLDETAFSIVNVPNAPGATSTNTTVCYVWDTADLTIRGAVAAGNPNYTVEYGTMDRGATSQAQTDCGRVGDGNAAWYPTLADAAAAPGGLAVVTAVRVRNNTVLIGANTAQVGFPVVPVRVSQTPTTAPGGYINVTGNVTNDENGRSNTTFSWYAGYSSALATATSSFAAPSVDRGTTTSATIQPVIYQPASGLTNPPAAAAVKVVTTLPDGCFTFVPGATVPASVVPAAPAAPAAGQNCRTVPGQVVTWNLGDLSSADGIVEDPITFGLNVSPFTPSNYAAKISTRITSTSDARGGQVSEASTNTTGLSQLLLSNSAPVASALAGVPVNYQVNWMNLTGSAFGQTYIVDVLPNNADGRSTAGLSGLTLGTVSTAPAGLPVQYTDLDTASLVAALASDPTGETGITWSSTTGALTGPATALRIALASVANGDTGTVSFAITPPADFSVGGVLSNNVTLKAEGRAVVTSTTTSIPSAAAVLSGVVTKDVNFSGAIDAADSALAATIKLSGYAFGPNGIDNSNSADDIAVHANTTSTADASGNYQFTLNPGKYSLSVLTPTGHSAVGIPASLLMKATVAATQNILVQETLAPPSLSNDTAAVSQADSRVIPITANDATLGAPTGGSPASVITVTSPVRGTVELIGNSVTYHAASAWPGAVAGATYTDTFTYTVKNAQNLSATATVTVTVYRLPSATADTLKVASTQATAVTVLGNDIGDGIAVTSVSTAGTGSVSVVANKIQFVPGAHTWGPLEGSYVETVTYGITDSQSVTASGTVTLTVFRAPDASGDAAILSAGSPATVAVLVNDEVWATPATVTIVTPPAVGSATVVGNSIRFDPLFAAGTTATVAYRVTDAVGQVSESVVQFQVAQVLSAQDDGSSATRIVLPADGSKLINVVGNDTGTLPAHPIDAAGPASHGTVSINQYSLLYTPTPGYAGPDSFTYSIIDITGSHATATVYVNVVSVDTLSAVNDGVNANGQRLWVPFNGSKTIDVLANDSGTSLRVTAVSSPQHGSVTFTATGVTYTPTLNYPASADVFTYTVTDAAGQTATATVYTQTLKVHGVANDGPITVRDGTKTAIDVLANDDPADPAWGLPAPEIVNAGGASHGWVASTATGVTYEPFPGYVGPDLFTYTSTNILGMENTATVSVVVAAGPVANPDGSNSDWILVPQVGSRTVDVLANDTGDGITITSASAQFEGEIFGEVSVAGGDLTFTPTGDSSGPIGVEYTITDSHGWTSDGYVYFWAVMTPETEDDGTIDEPLRVTAGGSVLVDVLFNDYGEDLEVTSVTGAVNGTASLQGGGVLYTGDDGFVGVEQLTYTVTDRAGVTATASIYLEVIGAPQANDDGADDAPLELGEEGSLLVDVLSNDSGTELAIDRFDQPGHGTVTEQNGSLLYAADSGFTGTDAFEYTVADPAGVESVATVYVVVLAHPEARDDGSNAQPVLMSEGTSSAITVTGNDSGTRIRVTDVGSTPAGVVSFTDSAVTFTPDEAVVGPVDFWYEITDAFGATSQATVFIEVLAAPSAVDDGSSSNPLALPQDGSLLVDVLDNDEGTDIEIDSVTEPEHGSASVDGGQVSYVPADGFAGADQFTYTIRDVTGAVTTASVFVTVVATPEPRDDGSLAEPIELPAGHPLTIDVLANDSGTDLTVTSADVDYNATSVTYDPADGFSGADHFTYWVTDSVGVERSATVYVFVVANPIAADDGSAANPLLVAEGSSLTVEVLGNDAGRDVEVTSTGGTPRGTVSNSRTGVTYETVEGVTGADEFTYTITDAFGVTSTGSVFIDVVPAPVANDDGEQSAYRVTLGGSISIDVLANDTGRDIRVTSANGDSSDGAGVVFDGTAPGASTFEYTVTDIVGATSTATVHVFVVAPPQANADGPTSVAENGSVTVDVLANDTGDGVRVTSTGFAQNGSVTFDSDSITFVPTPGFWGTDSVEYTITDALDVISSATLDLVVVANPVAVNDGAADAGIPIPEDGSRVIEVTANDSGTDFGVTSVTQPANGSVTLTDGVVTYIPDHDYVGFDEFDYTVTDALGVSSTATVYVTVIIAPTAADDGSPLSPLNLTEGTELTVDVLANDTGDTIALTAVGTAAGGSVSIVAGGASYSATDGFSGADSFSYTLTDVAGATRTATVFVFVAALPRANDDGPVELATNGSITTNVLGNDTGTGIAVTAVTGSATFTANSVTYTPAAGFSGNDSVTYTITDAVGVTSSATLTVVVVAAPVAAGDSAETLSITPVEVFVLGNDSGHATTKVTAVSQPAAGTAAVASGGHSVTFTPDGSQSGEVSFTYDIADYLGQTSQATVTITVHALPVAGDDAIDVASTTPTTLDVLANDTGDDLVIDSVSTDGTGTVEILDNAVVFTPGSHEWGALETFYLETVSYTTVDVREEAASGTALLAVYRAPTALPDSTLISSGATATVPALANDAVYYGTPTVVVDSGSATVDNGQLVYASAMGESGDAVIAYTVTDALGQWASSTATITIAAPLVTVDDGPGLVVSKLGAWIGVLANDSGSGVTLTSATAPGNGTTTIDAATGAVLYMPTAGFYGDDSFSYTVTDVTGSTSTAWVYLRVYPDPSLVDDTASTDDVTAILTDVLANDDVTAPAHISAVTQPSQGSVELVGDQLSFEPSGPGTVTFDYQVTDGVGFTAWASATVDVSATVLPWLEIELHLVEGSDPDDSGNSITVTGGALQPGTTYSVVMHSDPVTLATGTLDSGTLTQVLRFPAVIPSGTHTIIVTATGNNGLTVEQRATFQIAADGGVALAATGANPTSAVLVGTALLGSGLFLALLTLRRRRRFVS